MSLAIAGFLFPDLSTLPNMKLECRGDFPTSRGLYFVCQGSTLLYVGKAEQSFRQRWKSHHRVEQLKDLSDITICFLEVNSPVSDFEKLEKMAIAKFKPSLNGQKMPKIKVGCGVANNRQRITLSIPLAKRIRLFLLGRTIDLTTTEMAERILIDAVSNPDNWDEALKDMQQEAAIAQKPLQDYVKDLLREEFKDLPVDSIDWAPILDNSADTFVKQIIDLLEGNQIAEAINLLKSVERKK